MVFQTMVVQASSSRFAKTVNLWLDGGLSLMPLTPYRMLDVDTRAQSTFETEDIRLSLDGNNKVQ